MDVFKIRSVKAREIIDSRGNPTIEVDVTTLAGSLGRAAVPSGASRGKYEALEIRDQDGTRFLGKGVLRAVKNVNEIIGPKLIGRDSRRQREIDELMLELDGTPNKSKLGANAILAVSLAVAKAAAATSYLPLYRYLGGVEARVLPVPLMNIINGGKHAGNELSIQEFMIVPVGADSFKDSLRIGCEVYYKLKEVLKKEYGASAINVGDEGGFAPPMKQTREALDNLIKAIKAAGYSPENQVVLAMDAAASSFYSEDGKYWLDRRWFSKGDLLDFYVEITSEYPIVSIEDPFQEEDFETTAELTGKIGRKVQIVGDDLFVTNVERLKRGIEKGACNALLLKVNQIGTLTEAMEAGRLALRNRYNVIVSHRSGETEDTFIADLAVALNTGQIKTGAPARGERTAKYNRLIRIEEELSGEAIFPGMKVFKR